MRVLVTGGTGFVGANLVRRLLTGGHDVHLMVRPTARWWRLAGLETDVVLHQGHLGDDEYCETVFARARPDWTFHLAAQGAYSFETDYVAMARTNVLAAAQLISSASRHGCQALVLAGSSAEYGHRATPPSEDAPLAPNTHYAATKAAATAMAQVAATDPTTCPIVVLRLYSIFGPWEDPRRLMPTLLLNALDGRWPPLAAPETTRDFVYTEDAVDALLRAAGSAADHRGAVYNVGSGTGTSLRRLVGVVRAQLAVVTEPQFGDHPGRGWDAKMWWISDPRRIARDLGWTTTTSLEEGVTKFAAWLEAHRHLYATAAPSRTTSAMVP